MDRIVYSSDNPPARKGWATLDQIVWWALTRRDSSTFADIADRLPASMKDVPDRHILLSLRSFARAGRAEFTAGRWRPLHDIRQVSATGAVLTLRTYDTRKAA